MALVEISTRDRALLELIAKGEAVQGRDPYLSVYPGHIEPSLTQLTLVEVQQYQRMRISQGFRSSAVGKYQFIQATLRECIGYLNIDPVRICFTPDVQDALIIARLERVRRYSDWKAKTIATDRFMINLAKEFASIPVPYRMQGSRRIVNKGQSFYAGDGLNRAHHDADTFFANLVSILTRGEGDLRLVDISPSSTVNGARPANGTSTRAQTISAAAGQGVGPAIGKMPGSIKPVDIKLPEVDPRAVYTYRKTDPLDDRYDFRTGEKVKNILENGTGSQASNPQYTEFNSPAGSPISNAGTVPVFVGDEEYSKEDIESGKIENMFEDWTKIAKKATEPVTQKAEKSTRVEPSGLFEKNSSNTIASKKFSR